MFKRCSTAVALVLASSVPVLAQDSGEATLTVPEGFVAPEGSIVLQFAGTDALFLAPYEVAAELCQVSEGDFATVAESGVDVIYCEQLDEAEFTTFTETEGVESLVDRQSGDNDEIAVEGDVAEEAEEGAEGGDSAEGEDGAGDGDAGEGAGEGGTDGDGTETGGEGTGDDAGSDVDAEADADVEAEAGADADAEVDTGN
jgi:hypothetical protein